MYRVDTSARHKERAEETATARRRYGKRSGILEFAVLGLLRESPMHGYELRKRLNTSLGVFRAFSYGTLYPCLKTLVASGWLIEESGSTTEDALAAPLAGRRAKIVYRLTAEGKEHFEELLADGARRVRGRALRRSFRVLRADVTRRAHARTGGPPQSARGAPGEDACLSGTHQGAPRRLHP